MHLRHVGTRLGAARRALQVKAHGRQLGVGQAFFAVFTGGAGQHFRVAAFFNPGAAQRGQASADIDLDVGVGVGAAAVVDGQWWVLFPAKHGWRVVLLNLAKRYADVGA
ncbi:hypothetical protein D3C78_1704960 [compost metagenome]